MKPLAQKILLLLSAGVAFGFSYTPQRQWKIIKGVAKEWQKINKKELYEEIINLYRSKLITKKENSDGSYTLLLTEKGKIKTLTYHFQNMKIENKYGDVKFRLVVYDIPEKIKKGRDALRAKLKGLGFHELQKSVFVFPYECKNEIDFIIEFFNLRKYVRVGVIETIDNDLHLRQKFNLNN